MRCKAAGLGSPFYSEGVPQHRLVDGQIGDHALQSTVLVPELLQLARLADVEARVLLLPAIERRLRHAELATHGDDRRPALRLPQRLEDLLRVNLLFRIPGLLSSRESGLSYRRRQNVPPPGLRFGDPGPANCMQLAAASFLSLPSEPCPRWCSLRRETWARVRTRSRRL